MNPLNILFLVCVVSAAPQGYGAGGDGGLGVDLGGTGGHGGSGVGGGSVLPFILVGKGVLPESAIGGVGGVDGGVIGGEYSAPDAGAVGAFDVDVAGGFDAGAAGGFDAGVAGGFDAGVGIGEEVSHVSPPVSVYDAPH
ncbi:glycine-rich protein 23-like [Penaeus chinensis]|uniref:glycine-rich protein 23-like n=1 Tax=Penaeus chinensis TaxID=139456 RepID=UPI001FB6E591|nr:glycine-rich protein 23-like [Penaeus chinensis]